MQKILHIIKDMNDTIPIDIAKKQADENEIGLLYIHDAVLGDLSPDFAKVYVLDADVQARGLNLEAETVDYNGMVHLLFEYDKVVSW
ncbi:MAG: DsrH/TusB family sulfur metabolism protein [Methanosarcinaceae archaeon]|nr:hypothetical protein [Methanosarcinaceae archaeon]MCL7410521.1 hypothetical protein [Methanosarcinaceae archaeon]MDF1533131.1 DsrH/TusB family sulfur metabolism protein [Methanosarcinaceae archaeon]